MKNTIKFALVGALLAAAAPIASADCYEVSKLAAKEITAKPDQVLSILTKKISANKGCACEILKAAIVATEADKKQVAQMVEHAIELVPDKASLLTTCALAVAPDAHVEVMKVAAKYTNKNTGDSSDSAKGGAKSGVEGDVVEKPSGQNKEKRFIDPILLIGLGNGELYGTNPILLPPSNGGGGGQVGPPNPYN